MKNDLIEIISTPMEQLRFRDFMGLRSGWDEFSRMKLPELRRLAYSDEIESAIEGNADRASAYRWVLRGLPLDKAIRKVRTALEIRINAMRK